VVVHYHVMIDQGILSRVEKASAILLQMGMVMLLLAHTCYVGVLDYEFLLLCCCVIHIDSGFLWATGCTINMHDHIMINNRAISNPESYNSQFGYGGAIAATLDVHGTIVNSTFINNHAATGGG
jgi:hypothetical protein